MSWDPGRVTISFPSQTNAQLAQSDLEAEGVEVLRDGADLSLYEGDADLVSDIVGEYGGVQSTAEVDDDE